MIVSRFHVCINKYINISICLLQLWIRLNALSWQRCLCMKCSFLFLRNFSQVHLKMLIYRRQDGDIFCLSMFLSKLYRCYQPRPKSRKCWILIWRPYLLTNQQHPYKIHTKWIPPRCQNIQKCHDSRAISSLFCWKNANSTTPIPPGISAKSCKAVLQRCFPRAPGSFTKGSPEKTPFPKLESPPATGEANMKFSEV